MRNNADQMVYQTEKTLEDMKDKIDAADRSSIETELNKVKDALKGTDVDAIKNATEGLTKAFYAVSEKLYAQSGAQQPGPGAGDTGCGGNCGSCGNDGGDNVVDADYTVVDDDNK